MIFSYSFKRVTRSWKLFAALLLGIALASTFFSGINVGADTMAKKALDQQLSQIVIDVLAQPSGYYEPSIGRERRLSSQNITTITNLISSISHVEETEIISKLTALTKVGSENRTIRFQLAGISNNSHVQSGLTIVEGSKDLGLNEALVWTDSPDASNLKIGSRLQFNISIDTYVNYTQQQFILPLNLTIIGFARLSDQAASIIQPTYDYYKSMTLTMQTSIAYPTTESNLLILSWEKTFAKIIDEIYKKDAAWSPVSTEIPVYLDRESLVNPWDVSGSITRVQRVTDQMMSRTAVYGLSMMNNLGNVLSNYNYVSSRIRLGSLTLAIPVFFVAWYLVMAMSDVSLSLRRREIGLLLTKGLSRRQLLWMFLSEATLIGLLGGGIGIALSLLLIPLFAEGSGGLLKIPSIGLDTIVMTIAFSVTMTLLAVFQPARKASSLSTVDALREYVYSEPAKPYRRKLSWAAFILGAYKICILILGITFSPSSLMLGGNIFINILMGILMVLDYVLNYIGPVLFFWGFTKIFIMGSIKFQELASKAVRGILGDLSIASMRNVQRNPLRIASIAFLVALIIGYSVSTVGTLASEQDYNMRSIYSDVGADLSLSLISGENVTEAVDKIKQLQGVSSVALECTFYETSSGMMIKAVNPRDWMNTAYYESEWYTGNNVKDAFESMMSDNATIILDRGIAIYLNLSVSDTVALTFEGQQGSSRYNLKIVGFFGPEPRQTSPVIYYTEGVKSGSLSETTVLPPYYSQRYWSYVPEGFLNQHVDIDRSSIKMLVKLNTVGDGKAISQKIRDFDLKAGSIYSVAERLEALQSDYSLIGLVNIQRLGVVFSILAASIGTGLVTLVSLRERRKEIALMSVRGLSYKQLVTILLSENLAVVVFSVLLGFFVGFTILRGNVASANSILYSIVTWRIVFPLDSLLMLFLSFSLVFITTILPATILVRGYLSELERIVREV